MSKSEVLSAAARRNMFLSPDAVEIIMSNSDPVAFVNTVLSSLANNPMFVTKEDVMNCLQGDMRIVESPKTFTPHNKANCEIKVVLADVAGVSRRTIQMYESGMGAMIDAALRLEEYLDTEIIETVNPFEYKYENRWSRV